MKIHFMILDSNSFRLGFIEIKSSASPAVRQFRRNPRTDVPPLSGSLPQETGSLPTGERAVEVKPVHPLLTRPAGPQPDLSIFMHHGVS